MNKPSTFCQRCGDPTDHITELTGEIKAKLWICMPCSLILSDEFAERRRQFDELISGGMSREMANMVMIGRMTDGKSS